MERGGNKRERAVAAQWEDYPMPGLQAAAVAACTGGSVRGGLSSDSRSGTEQRFSFYYRRGGEHRVQLGQSELTEAPVISLRANSSRGKCPSQSALSLHDGLRAL